MAFLILEQDPLVRNDIYETLETAFSGQTIVVVETLEGLKDVAFDVSGPTVAVMGLPAGMAELGVGQIDDLLSSIRYVIIGDDTASDHQAGDRFVHLARPFSSGSLLNSVRMALSGFSQGSTEG